MKNLLHTEDWPEAVDPLLLCLSEEDKISRAEGIIDLVIGKPLSGKRFLDIGCGEGHVPIKILEHDVSAAIGYDKKDYPNWESDILTTDLKRVTENGPYDIILIFDVIDHTTKEDAIKILSLAKNLLSENGKIYLRTHPFSSRHATHLYHQLNKAYIHLIFSEDEIKELGLVQDTVEWKVIYPILEYHKVINQSGLLIKDKVVLRRFVEPFFEQNNEIKRRITKIIPTKEAFPYFQLEQQFHDFVLTN